MGGTGIKGNGEERGKRECMDGKGKEGNEKIHIPTVWRFWVDSKSGPTFTKGIWGNFSALAKIQGSLH